MNVNIDVQDSRVDFEEFNNSNDNVYSVFVLYISSRSREKEFTNFWQDDWIRRYQFLHTIHVAESWGRSLFGMMKSSGPVNGHIGAPQSQLDRGIERPTGNELT